MKLVECIPNFSEGRRPQVVSAIEAAITGVSGVQMLDRHSDEDHNRTVLTFVAEPEAALEAAFAGIQKAAELIDMEQHEGEHPRLGATDVVPFVPIRGLTMEECVEIAVRLGERVGSELHIPVYLYEEAATRPERQNLAEVRRGEYEKLKDDLGTDPARDPDFGPSTVGSAGATVIGARQPLIAYNVYLTTDDVSIAKKIAKSVRHSGGGLRFVKALGLMVEGRAQVSMNLTDFTRTPVFRVVELIRREAQRYGVDIHHSELVGLTPGAALIESAAWYLQLDGLERDQVLENRLMETKEQPSLLERLASGDPTPGGGSASAYAGAMAGALVAMVGRVTVGKKKYADVEDKANELIDRADSLRGELEAAVERDAAAFDAVMAAYRLPKEDGDARTTAIDKATREASRVPLQVARDSLAVLELAQIAAEIGNLNAISDAGVAGSLAAAAIQGAGFNVRINADGLGDDEEAAGWLAELQRIESSAEASQARLREAIGTRAA